MKKKELRAHLKIAFSIIEKIGGVVKQTQGGGFCVELPDSHEDRVKKLINALESRGHTVHFLADGTLEISSPIGNGIMSEENKAQIIAELRDKNAELTEKVKELGEYAETLREILEKKEKQVEMLSTAIGKMGFKIESSYDGKTLFITEQLGNERFARAAYDNNERVKELEAELERLQQENFEVAITNSKIDIRINEIRKTGKYKEFYASDLLREFWQRSSDACPLECTEAEKEEIDFKAWVSSLICLNGHYFKFIKK